MSKRQLLREAVADGRLSPIQPRLPSAPVQRQLFGSPNIVRLVNGPWDDRAEEYRCGKLWEDFDRFTEGRLISVALNNPYNHPKSTYLSRLDPTHDEVWEIRSRDPKPAIRVFGMFVDFDVLVLFNCGYRKSLGGPKSPEFDRERRKCRLAWASIFLTLAPHSGCRIEDYVSRPAISV